jgi:hypothetical protein
VTTNTRGTKGLTAQAIHIPSVFEFTGELFESFTRLTRKVPRAPEERLGDPPHSALITADNRVPL